MIGFYSKLVSSTCLKLYCRNPFIVSRSTAKMRTLEWNLINSYAFGSYCHYFNAGRVYRFPSRHLLISGRGVHTNPVVSSRSYQSCITNSKLFSRLIRGIEDISGLERYQAVIRRAEQLSILLCGQTGCLNLFQNRKTDSG